MSDRTTDTEDFAKRLGFGKSCEEEPCGDPNCPALTKHDCVGGEYVPKATKGAAKCHHTVSNGFIEVKDSALNGFKTVTLSDDDGREIKLRLSRRVTVFLWEMLSPHVKVEPLK